jgi:transposase InsO family protein
MPLQASVMWPESLPSYSSPLSPARQPHNPAGHRTRTTSRPGWTARICMTRGSTGPMPSWRRIMAAWSTRPARSSLVTNALAESFFASLKGELIDLQAWPTRAMAGRAVVEYVPWFNGTRLHSTLSYRSPAEFEEAAKIKKAAECTRAA